MHSLKQLLIPHRKNNYRPHLIRRHGLAFALMFVLGIQVISGLQISAGGQVLGYATNITVSGLLSETNSERSAAGKASLKNHSKLNASAQAKANHMISENYWAHTAPDGTTPWYWFDWAGYDYVMAGENLAYGFDTSSGVVNGWMNSPSHRDNMLNGAFEDVGFGIANGSNYQGGPNTVVVAHYAEPAVLSGSSGNSSGGSSPKPTSQPPAEPEPAATPAETKPEPKPEPDTAEETTEPVEEPGTSAELDINSFFAATEPKRISNLEALLSGQAGWALYSTSAVALALGFVYAYRHVLFVHRVVIKGEQFIVSHPMLEASIIYTLIWLLLAGSFGQIL